MTAGAHRPLRPPRAAPDRAATLALLAGAVVGIAAAGAAAGSTRTAGLLFVALVTATLAAVVRDVRRLLVAIVLLDIPFQWDFNIGWQPDAAALDALAGWSISATTIALACLYGLWIADGLLERGAPVARVRSAALPLLFLGFMLLSLVVAEDRTLAGFKISLAAQMAALFLYLASTLRTPSDVRFVVLFLLVGLCLEAAISLAIYGTGTTFRIAGINAHARVGETSDRIGGTMGSPTVAGSYFAFMTCIALAVFLGAAEARLRRLALLATALGIAALVLTLARGAWIALVVGVVVLALARRGMARGVSARAVVAMLAAALVLVPTARLIETRLTADDQGSAASRVPLIQLAGRMIEDHPLLGVGANNFTVRIPEYAGPQFSSDWLRTVHNKWLLTWTDAGIGALLTLLAFVGVTIGRAWRARRAADPIVASAGAGVAAAVAGHAVNMNFDILQGRTTSQMLWTAAALVAAPAFAVSAPRTRRHPTPRRAVAHDRRRPRAGTAGRRSAAPL